MIWRHVPAVVIATLVTYILHESTHWAMGEALGFDKWMKINSVGSARGEYSVAWHGLLICTERMAGGRVQVNFRIRTSG